MKYKIYHAIEPIFGMSGVGESPKYPEDYELVAVVESENLADTFRITNHIQDSWTKNPEVLELPKGERVRSTSVGDVVVDEAGKAHLCAMCGWDEIAA